MNCGKKPQKNSSWKLISLELCLIKVSPQGSLVGRAGERRVRLSPSWNNQTKVMESGHGKKKTEQDPSNLAEIESMGLGG